MWRNMPKVIHSLQLHISHQMRSYFSAKIIWPLSYTCFLGTWALGQFWGRKDPNTPKSSTESHKKKFKVFNFLFHIKWDLMLVSRPSVGQIIPVSQVLRYWGNFGKLGLNTPNHMQGLMKNNPKSSAPCFTSNDTLL